VEPSSAGETCSKDKQLHDALAVNEELRDDGIAHLHKYDRYCPRLPLEGNGRRGRACQDDVGLQTDQLVRERSHPIGVNARPTKVDPHVAAIAACVNAKT